MKNREFEKEVREWTRTLNEYPQDMLAKLTGAGDEFYEITPPTCGDRVYLFNGNRFGEEGEITGVTGKGTYLVRTDGGVEEKEAGNDFGVKRDGFFPMWGFLWSFKDCLEECYAETREGLQIMADCGFRVYRSDEWGVFFGIDGAGYDFYEKHRIPLYMKLYPERCEKAS